MDHIGIALAVGRNDRPLVLATIVSAVGHSYRKEGASMLFATDGERIGSISPGCLEADLALRIESIWLSRTADFVVYDSRSEDSLWGESVGCGGKLTILLEPLHGQLRRSYLKIIEYVNTGLSCVLLRSLTKDNRIKYRVFSQLGIQSGIHHRQSKRADMLLQTRLYPFQLPSIEFAPRPRLIVFGAGLDMQPVAAMAQQIGFHVVIADWREDWCTSQRFPGAELVTGSVETIIRLLHVQSADYVLISSHQQRKDRQFLAQSWDLSPHYIGILGSKQRIAALLDGFPRSESVFAPVGLKLGAVGAEEIAVSIVAQLIQHKASAGARSSEANQAAVISQTKGGYQHEGSGHLFGRRAKQPHGTIQAGIATVAQ